MLDKVVPQLHEVLHIEGHLRTQLSQWIYPSNLNELLVNVVADKPVHLLPSRYDAAKWIKG